MSDKQWEELDGDPNTVAAKGKKYTELAEAIARSVSTLQQIVDDTNTTAKAMDKTRKLAGEVREDIEKARERYSYTGEALTTYSSALRAAKAEADPAAQRLRTLRAELETAQATARTAQSNLDDLPDDASDADKSGAHRAQTQANNAVADLQSQITIAENDWNSGHNDKNTAARSAISKIEEVVSGDKVNGLEDGFWDKVGDVLSKVVKIVKIICDIAGILAIFLSWVPVLGQVLLALAAIGSIIAIIEGIVKISKEGFSWGAVLGIGLGVMGLFGGRAIGAVAKYAKARSVVTTSARMTSRASKLKFGNSLIKSSRKVMGMTNGQRVTSVLKGPFQRTATDKAIWGLLKNGEASKALTTWRGAKFPLPYKDGGLRFAMGNDDVVDMMKHFSQTGLHIDRATQTAQTVATLGSVTHQMTNLGNSIYKLGNDINGGNGWGIANNSGSLVTNPAGGSYGSLVNFGTKYGAQL